MKVSIIIPVYNAKKYLVECIESALNQTYKNTEVIAVNNGSVDNSLQILKQYSNRIQIIDKKHGVTATALNVAIKAATGEWIKRLDADDVLYENAVEILINAAKKREDAKSCIFFTYYDVIDSFGKKIYEFIEPNYNNISNFERGVRLLDHNMAHGITSLIHRSMFEKCGFFNENIKYVEDYEFWLRCQLLYDCQFVLIPKIIAKYRIHEAQLTQKKRKMMTTNSKKIKSMILEQMDVELKDKYVNALKKFQERKYPKKIRIILHIRDFLLEILPTPLSEKILNAWIKSKTANKIYQRLMSSWNEPHS